jgi:hypothetical protein
MQMAWEQSRYFQCSSTCSMHSISRGRVPFAKTRSEQIGRGRRVSLVRWQGNLCAGAGRFVLTAPATVHMPVGKRAIEGRMMFLNNVGCGRSLFDLREMGK